MQICNIFPYAGYTNVNLQKNVSLDLNKSLDLLYNI